MKLRGHGRPVAEMTSLTCVSLFSGCGGLDLGFERAGFNVVLANDIDHHCAISHEANFPASRFVECPVSEFVGRLKSDEFGIEPGSVDVVVGGPPCPPFSKSRFYRTDKPRALADELAAETVGGFLNTVEYLQPRAFVFENVAGFRFKVHREAFDHVLEAAHELGYETEWKVMNAADYGVPQIRERFILVGTRVSKFEFPSPTHGKPESDPVLEGHLAPWVTAGDVISDLDTEENADDAGHFAGGKHHDLLRQVPPGDNYLFFTEKRGHPNPKFEWRSRYWSFLLKLSPEMPSWTIQARRSNNMGPLHWRNRILRIAEVKRLQTFPDSWVLDGKVEAQWRQVGNAVPPRLATVVAEALAANLQDAGNRPLLANVA